MARGTWRVAVAVIVLAVTSGLLLSRSDLRLLRPPEVLAEDLSPRCQCGVTQGTRTVPAVRELRIEGVKASARFRTGWPAYVSVKVWLAVDTPVVWRSLGLILPDQINAVVTHVEDCCARDPGAWATDLYASTGGTERESLIGELTYSLSLVDAEGREVWRIDSEPPIYGGLWDSTSPGYNRTTWSLRRWGWFLVPDLRPGKYTLRLVIREVLTNLTAEAEEVVEVVRGEDPLSAFSPRPIDVEIAGGVWKRFLREAASMGWRPCLTSEGIIWDVEVAPADDPMPARTWSSALVSTADGGPRAVIVQVTVFSDEERAAKWVRFFAPPRSEGSRELSGIGSEAVMLRRPKESFRNPTTGEVMVTGPSVELLFRRGNVVAYLYSEEFNFDRVIQAWKACWPAGVPEGRTVLSSEVELLALARLIDANLIPSLGAGG